MSIPTPPDAYWSNIPWWAWLCFMLIALIVSVVIAPWCVQRARGHPSAMQSREQALASREAAVSNAREEALRDAREGEATARAELIRERARWNAERDALEADRDDGWDRGRGMEDIAHSISHKYRGLAQRFGALVILVGQFVRGEIMTERARALLDETPPAAPLAEIPKLREVERKKPR